MSRLFICLFLITLSLLTKAQESGDKIDCSILKKGVFKYLDIEDTTAYFEINKERHTEYHSNNKYRIKSKINWISDCQYVMEMLSNTVPGFPFKPGDLMMITIDKIEGNLIYYTSEVQGEMWKGRLLKLK